MLLQLEKDRLTASEVIAKEMSQRSNALREDVSSDVDPMGMPQVKHDGDDATQLPSSSSSIQEDSNPAGGGTAPSTPADPPHSSAPCMLCLLAKVLDGFELEHEKSYFRFMQQRHLSSTTAYLNMRLLVLISSLILSVRSLGNGEVFKACCNIILWAAPFLVCLVLCRTRQLNSLNWGFICMAICRIVSYSLLMFGLPECFSFTILQILVVPLETVLFSHFEPVPIRLYVPFHHTLWSIALLRNSCLGSSAQSPFLFVAGYLTAFAIRVRADMQDRLAYIVEVNARHDD